jgi:spore maturation protein SpmB
MTPTPIQKLQERMRRNRLNFDYNPNEPRVASGPGGGRWTSGGASQPPITGGIAGNEGASKPSVGLRQKWRGMTAKQKGSAALHAPLHLEHAIKAGAKGAVGMIGDLWKSSGAGWNTQAVAKKMDGIAGKTVKGVAFVGKAAMKAAFLPWIACEKAVEGVARAKGTLVTCYDAVNCKAIALGFHAAAMPGAAAASIWFPTASMAYLAHAAVKDFPAVRKAAATGIKNAKSAIGRVANKAGLNFSADGDGGMDANANAAVGVLADALKAHGGSDWYWALLSEAMSNAGSASEAVALADRAFNASRGKAIR